MAKTLVVDDTETTTVEIQTMDDPTIPSDHIQRDLPEVWFIANCRGCGWNSFINDGATHPTEGDAINDAETHLDRHDTGTVR